MRPGAPETVPAVTGPGGSAPAVDEELARAAADLLGLDLAAVLRGDPAAAPELVVCTSAPVELDGSRVAPTGAFERALEGGAPLTVDALGDERRSGRPRWRADTASSCRSRSRWSSRASSWRCAGAAGPRSTMPTCGCWRASRAWWGSRSASPPYRFSTYASWWIRQNVSRALSQKVRAIRLPPRVAQAVSLVARTERSLAMRLGRDPSAAEIAAAAGLEVQTVEGLRRPPEVVVSLDRPVGAEGDGVLGDLLGDGDGVGTESAVLDVLQQRAIRDLVQRLPARQRAVIEMRFPSDGEPKRLADIGALLGVTRERARQIESQALAALGRMPEAQALWTASVA